MARVLIALGSWLRRRRYCAGTVPWGNTGDHRDFEPQRHDDGCIEVIGFTMASLVFAYFRWSWSFLFFFFFSLTAPPLPPLPSRRRCRWAGTARGCTSAERWSSPRSRRCRFRWVAPRRLLIFFAAALLVSRWDDVRPSSCPKVDGEPCRLAPSTLRISLRNQANMVQKSKRRTSVPLLNE